MEFVLLLLVIYVSAGWLNGRREARERFAEAEADNAGYRYQRRDAHVEAAKGFWFGALAWPLYALIVAWDATVRVVARLVVPELVERERAAAEAEAAERIRVLDLETAAILEHRRLEVERQAYDRQHRLDLEDPK